MKELLSAFDSERLSLKNKVVMAPMTRSRATHDHVPTPIMATYYRERASVGLIITEGTAPSPNGVGYARIPAIYNDEQVEGWKAVTKAVHEEGGKIFVQLMHTGRIGHPDNQADHTTIVAPSAIAPTNTKMYVDGKGQLEIPVPKEMTLEDIEYAQNEYVQAAKNAMAAGFDGVELHGANGYLIEQFLNPHANQRTDQYGGSDENRSRFALEVAQKVIDAIGADKVGIRLSPNGAFNDVLPFEGQEATFEYLAKELDQLGVVYIHLVNHAAMGAPALPDELRDLIRNNFKGTLILSGGYDHERAEQDLESKHGDLIAFGRPLIANPDIIERWKNNAPLNEVNYDLLYTPGEVGYNDYPTLADAK